jgi:hypothetical protein
MISTNDKLSLFLKNNYDIYYIIKKLLSDDNSYKYYTIKNNTAFINAFDIYHFEYEDLFILQNLLKYNIIKSINIDCSFVIKMFPQCTDDFVIEHVTQFFPYNKIILDYSLLHKTQFHGLF